MCGRFDTSHLTWADIHRQLSTLLPVTSAPLNVQPSADVRPTTPQAVARVEDGGWIVENMRWSLVPHYWNGKPLKDTEKGKGDGFKLTTFNCKTEPFTDPDGKPSVTWAGPFKSRRCIVPASAWFEWTGDKDSKAKHRFARADGQPIWFAGLWSPCRTLDEGEIKSFAIFTGPSGGWLSDYHDRAPVILEPDEWSTWLDSPQGTVELMKSVRPERFEVDVAA
ncbi:MAG TPA: SOS response-associated peptidase [Phenylobacterium sp.]|jgi:putative SOS response-associated peptidase YedK|uniref:SOS response-associated peptidase n=1 Tax=Phenylobacterium sp. TaxID=1871053 RepID=UPI002BC3E445|nr:SOS response-associated peptidase [Phenylobacterium sp.]HXA39647.1 SOS response-associated peptidase [Phenylobacterium sp.]